MRAVFALAAAFTTLALAHASILPEAPVRVVRVAKRQGLGLPDPSQIPQQCQGNCTAPLTTLNTCGNPVQPSCLCDASFINNYFGCLLCLGQVTSTSDFSIPQSNVDQIAAACKSIGIPVPDPTFPGQPSDRPTPSLTPTGSVSASGTRSSTPGSGPVSSTSSPSPSSSSSQLPGGIETQTGLPPPPPSSGSSAQTVPNSLPPATGASSAGSAQQTQNGSGAVGVRSGWGVGVAVWVLVFAL